MVGENPKYSEPVPSGYVLMNYSLKQNNFDKYLSSPYYKNGYWYTDAWVNINNYNMVNSYYGPVIKSNIYLVPFYFKVEYTDYSNCIEDLNSNYQNYKDYEIVSSYRK